jgi:hypothetical protein
VKKHYTSIIGNICEMDPYLIHPRSPAPNTVVKIAVVTMEVEYKYQISLFEHNHLVLLVFPRNVLVIISHELQLYSQFHQKIFIAVMTSLASDHGTKICQVNRLAQKNS